MSVRIAPKKTMLLLSIVLAMSLLACSLSTFLGSEPTPTPAPTVPPQPANIITNGVMAKDVSGDNFDPVGITDSFPADTSTFHAVVTIAGAPDNTNFQVAWLTASNSKMGEFALTTGGSRNLDFSFKPDAGNLPPGKYQVQIYVNGDLDRTLNFAVLAAGTAPTPSGPKPSGLITSVTMAEDSNGDTKDPVNPTTVFKPTAVFHAVVALQNAPANTKFTAAWYVVDVGSAAPPNSKIESTDITTSGSRNIDFTLKPVSAWPVGSYRVEISVNDVLDTVKTFGVK